MSATWGQTQTPTLCNDLAFKQKKKTRKRKRVHGALGYKRHRRHCAEERMMKNIEQYRVRAVFLYFAVLLQSQWPSRVSNYRPVAISTCRILQIWNGILLTRENSSCGGVTATTYLVRVCPRVAPCIDFHWRETRWVYSIFSKHSLQKFRGLTRKIKIAVLEALKMSLTLYFKLCSLPSYWISMVPKTLARPHT